MRGWIDICSDVNWSDYHGMWGKKGPDGAWYVLRFTNMVDACGEDARDEQYHCEVLRVFLPEVTREQRRQALSFAGSDDDTSELALLYACVSYGIAAPLSQHSARSYPDRVRAVCRREAEDMMKDESKLDTALDRPVNKIGTTAREFGQGNIMAGLTRYMGEVLAGENPGEDMNKNILLKMHGVSVDDLKGVK